MAKKQDDTAGCLVVFGVVVVLAIIVAYWKVILPIGLIVGFVWAVRAHSKSKIDSEQRLTHQRKIVHEVTLAEIDRMEEENGHRFERPSRADSQRPERPKLVEKQRFERNQLPLKSGATARSCDRCRVRLSDYRDYFAHYKAHVAADRAGK